MVATLVALAVLDALLGGRPNYRVFAAGGDFVVPGCRNYQQLHSDFGKYEPNTDDGQCRW